MSSPASPAFVTFTTALFNASRAVELIIHTTDVADPTMVELAGRQLRHHLAALAHAVRQLDPVEHLDACSLLAGLAQRCTDRAELPALAPCLELLDRFAQ